MIILAVVAAGFSTPSVYASGLSTVASSREFFDSLPASITGDSLTMLRVDAFTPDIESVVVEARGALKGARGEWGMMVGRYRIALSFRPGRYDDLDGGQLPQVIVSDIVADSVIATLQGDPVAWRPKGDNSLIVSVSSNGDVAIEGGSRVPERLGVARLDSLDGASIGLWSTGRLTAPSCVIETFFDRTVALMTPWTMDALSSHLAASTDPMEGMWEYLDGENDPDRALAGGRYRLATVADNRGDYLLIYLDGAVVNPTLWRTGMLKGRLTPTIFIDHYNVEWNDSRAIPILFDVSATVEQSGALLTVSFPTYRTHLRFSRLLRR